MDNIVEITDTATLLWLRGVIEAAIANDQTVRIMTGATPAYNYMKVARGGSMWTAPIRSNR